MCLEGYSEGIKLQLLLPACLFVAFPLLALLFLEELNIFVIKSSWWFWEKGEHDEAAGKTTTR